MVTVLFNDRKLGIFCGYESEQMRPQSLYQRSSLQGLCTACIVFTKILLIRLDPHSAMDKG